MLLQKFRDSFWRLSFIAGAAIPVSVGSHLQAILGGLKVDIGVKPGNGCASGHSVYRIGLLSVRSLVDIVIFILYVKMTVTTVKQLLRGYYRRC